VGGDDFRPDVRPALYAPLNRTDDALDTPDHSRPGPLTLLTIEQLRLVEGLPDDPVGDCAAVDPAPLHHARTPEKKVVGTCRSNAGDDPTALARLFTDEDLLVPRHMIG
jgi:hypothetical protein